MRSTQLNRVSSFALVALSLVALLTVVTGLLHPPQQPEADEGVQAHIFQLSIAGLLPVTMLFLATADWREPWRGMRPLALAAVATFMAFAGLYYLEHLR